jgi:hypothetical protein
MKEDQKLNLICRMAGNIFNDSRMTHTQAIKHAIKLFEIAEEQLKEKENG